MADTLACFKGSAKLSASELNLEGVKQNAINNRLETLRAAGILDRERGPRSSWLYFRSKGKADGASPIPFLADREDKNGRLPTDKVKRDPWKKNKPQKKLRPGWAGKGLPPVKAKKKVKN